MKTRHAKIQYWDDERAIGNSLIVTLKRGWKFSEDSLLVEHVRGFDTVKEAMQSVRATVACSCSQCV